MATLETSQNKQHNFAHEASLEALKQVFQKPVDDVWRI